MKMAKYLLYLYPRGWRRRYEDELLALLEEDPCSLNDCLDLLLGALDAHLHPQLSVNGLPRLERVRQMLTTLRHSLLLIFCAYLGFILAGAAFAKLTEDASFQVAIQGHGVLMVSFNLTGLGALVTLLAVLAGGLPVALAIIRSAWTRRRYGPVLLLSVPLLAAGVFVGNTLLLERLDCPPAHLAPFWHIFFTHGLFIGVFLACALVSAWALCSAVEGSEIPEHLLSFALLPSLLTTLAMLLVLASTLVWGLGLAKSVPQLFASNAGIFGTSTAASWLRIVIAMALATLLAVCGLVRGHSAHSALRASAH
jgi:hypothetical protein